MLNLSNKAVVAMMHLKAQHFIEQLLFSIQLRKQYHQEPLDGFYLPGFIISFKVSPYIIYGVRFVAE